MSETLIPTMGLRFVEKYVPAPELGPNIESKRRVLQQRFDRPGGGSVWKDVPFVDDESKEPK